jgi:hypothetical protein
MATVAREPAAVERILETANSGSPNRSGRLPVRLIGAWPVLDPSALHGLAGEIVATIEPHTEADPAGILVSTLVEFGALVGAGPHAVADSAPHPARLFAVLVGETSKGRKGSAGKNVERLTSMADPRFVRERHLNGFGSGEALIDAVRGSEVGERDHRVLVGEPEFARILNVAARDGSTLSAIIRQAWDGGRLSVRSRAGTAVAEDSHVCVLAHGVAEELRSLLDATQVASGFANRFIFACVKRSKRLPSGGNLDDAELAPLAERFATLASKARKVGILRRTPAAEVLWAQHYGEMDSDEPGGLLAAVIARDAAQTLRLSVAYALLDGSSRIDVEHVRAAWALWSYCRASAGFIFGESVGDAVADRLLRAAREAGPDGLNGTQQRDLFDRHASGSQLEAARSLLERKGLATVEPVSTGGRPSTILRAVETLLSLKSLLSHPASPPRSPLSLSSDCDKSDKSAYQEKRGKAEEPCDCDKSDESDKSPLSLECDESDQSPFGDGFEVEDENPDYPDRDWSEDLERQAMVDEDGPPLTDDDAPPEWDVEGS